MNKINSLFVLIRSLTKAEKRYFHLQSNLQSGKKTYLFLFNLFEKFNSPEDVQAHFRQSCPGKSFEMACKHLYRVLLEALLMLREKQDIQTEIFHTISKSGILYERELLEDALMELNKAKRLAEDFEHDSLLLLIRRTELQYLSMSGFKNMSERELVSKQMKISEIVKYSRNINMHTQLYDILVHRLTHKGYVRSDKQKADLNDLVLSELHLIANGSYRGFEAQKLHLLFQAFYYLHSGNYKSAIRFYYEVIALFNEHRHLLLHPPMYYLSAVHGILDSLHTAGLYGEMPYFLSRLKEIEEGDYPTEFILKIRSILFYYESSRLLNTGHFKEVKALIGASEEKLFKKIHLLGLEDQLKILLVTVIFHLSTGNYPEAKKNMKIIFGAGKLFGSFPSFKTVRLVNLLLQAELGNLDFIENEIVSIKRSIHYEKQNFKTEKLVFRFVRSYPLPLYKQERIDLWQRLCRETGKIGQNKYERQLLKIFDFLSWFESKLTRRPFDEILRAVSGIKK